MALFITFIDVGLFSVACFHVFFEKKKEKEKK